MPEILSSRNLKINSDPEEVLMEKRSITKISDIPSKGS
jgi:hypothetical protein